MKPGPDKEYGPKLATLYREYCEKVFAESGATTIKVTSTFIYKKKKGDLQMSTFTTPDTKTERMLDGDVVMPRGSKLQQDATLQLRSEMTHLTKTLGGK